MADDTDTRPSENGKLATFNLKLSSRVRDVFKSNTHDRGLTMQAALAAFVESYNDNPDRFRLVMEMAES